MFATWRLTWAFFSSWPYAGASNQYECLAGVAYKDYGPTFPNLDSRQCANLCYSMPNCRVWTMTPDNDCIVRFDNATSQPEADVKSCLQVRHRRI